MSYSKSEIRQIWYHVQVVFSCGVFSEFHSHSPLEINQLNGTGITALVLSARLFSLPAANPPLHSQGQRRSAQHQLYRRQRTRAGLRHRRSGWRRTYIHKGKLSDCRDSHTVSNWNSRSSWRSLAFEQPSKEEREAHRAEKRTAEKIDRAEKKAKRHGDEQERRKNFEDKKKALDQTKVFGCAWVSYAFFLPNLN